MPADIRPVADLAALPIFPFADEFPYLSDDETTELANDIEANGLLHPIVLFEGQVLDGRNRLRAAAQTKLTDLPVETYTGTDPVGFVISVNLQRRHLTTGQRAFLALKLLPYLEEKAQERMLSGKSDPEQNSAQGRSAEIAAEKLAVSHDSVKKAKALALGTSAQAKEAAAKVKSGAWSLNEAVQHAKPKANDKVIDVDPKSGRVVEAKADTVDATVTRLVNAAADLAQLLKGEVNDADRTLALKGAKKALATLAKVLEPEAVVL